MPTQQAPPPAAPGPPPGPGPVAAFVQPLSIGLLVALAFVGIYLAALHKPQPHHLPAAVVAPLTIVAQLQRSLAAPAGDAVDLRPAGDVSLARGQLEDGQLVAAYLPGQGGQGSRLLLAGAQGTAVTQAVTGIFTDTAQGQGARLQVDDVVATLLLVILGNASSGGVVPAWFLPGGFRQLSPALPPGAATQALGRVDYFDPGAALGPVGVLAAWALGGLLVLVVRGRRQTRPAAVPAEQAHLTP